MSETREMQKKIAEKLGLNPVESEVVVLYDGERDKVIPNDSQLIDMPCPIDVTNQIFYLMTHECIH